MASSDMAFSCFFFSPCRSRFEIPPLPLTGKRWGFAGVFPCADTLVLFSVASLIFAGGSSGCQQSFVLFPEFSGFFTLGFV